MPAELSEKVLLVIYRTKFGPMTITSEAYQVNDLIPQDIKTVDTASDWLIANLCRVNEESTRCCF